MIGVVATLMLAAAASATAGPAFSLMVSSAPNRSSAVALSGAQLNGGEYVFLTPTSGVTGVAMWLDDPSMSGTPTNIERYAQADSTGSASPDDAWLWSMSAVLAGTHSISARVVTRSATIAFATSFSVRSGVVASPELGTTSTPPRDSAGTAALPAASGATTAPGATTGPGATTALATAATARHTTGPAPVRTLAPTPVPIPTPAPRAPTQPPSGWTRVVNDQFNSGGVPSHWDAYDGPYGSGPQNCAAPSQVTVSGGVLHLTMSYLASGNCGAGWYSGGLALGGFSSVDQRITVRFRVVDAEAVSSHMIIPMRWVDNDALWPAGGEEDYFEGDSTGGMNTFLHYGSRNSQVYSPTYRVDLTQWHTIQTTRLNHVVTVSVDGVSWTYSGSASTLPDTLKHVVLQQECQSNGCPAGTTGSEDIQIDWITVENAG